MGKPITKTVTKTVTLKDKFGGTTKVRVEKLEYHKGGTALQGIDNGDGYAYTTFTVWVPGIPEGLVALKTYGENEGLCEQLAAQGLIEITDESHRGFPLAKVLF